MSKERAAKVMQEIFSKGTYEGDLLGINEGRKMKDTPRTDAAVHPSKLLRRPDGTFREAVDAVFARQLERELAEAQAEITRLKGEAESWEKVFDRTCEHLADAKTNAERYQWLRERHENTVMDIYNSISPAMIKPELLDAAVDAAMKEGKR